MQRNTSYLPVIYPVDRDPNKEWYVKYPAPDGSGYRKKYGKLQQCRSLEEKLAECDRIIREDLKHITITQNARPADSLILQIQQFHEYQCVGLKPKSISTYNTHVEEFARWYRTKWRKNDDAVMGLDFITHLKMEKGIGNTTANAYRCTLNGIFKRLVKLKKIPINPFDNTLKLRERRQTKEWFRQEQIDYIKPIILARDPQLWLGCRLQFFCFIRPCAELGYTKIGDIEIIDKRIRVRAEVGKKATEDEYVRIPDHMLAELDELCRNYPSHFFLFGHNGKPGLRKLGRDTMSKRHQAIMKELRYAKNYTYYSWKNTGAVHMLKQGINVVQIGKLMRHKSLDYTQEYFKSLGFDDMAEDLNSKYPRL